VDHPELDPVYSPDYERAVLSDMIDDPSAADYALSHLRPEAFYGTAHQIIFTALADLCARGETPDFLSITGRLNEKGVLDKVGGEEYIMRFCSSPISSSAAVEAHCAVLREKLALRKIAAAAHSVERMCYASDADPDALASLLQTQMGTVLAISGDAPYRHIGDILCESIEIVERRATATGPTGVPTGLTRLDRVLDGYQKGDLYLLAARPGKGKSALAINNFALSSAKHGHPTGVFSLEMKSADLGIRLLASEARRNLAAARLRESKLNPLGWRDMQDAQGRLSALKLYIADQPGLTISQITARAKQMQRDFGMELLVVDYLQLMRGEGMGETREREVAAISAGLKSIAKLLDIPVIALSQFNRGAAESETRRPRASDLRESGALEQDADCLIFIHDPSRDEKSALSPRLNDGETLDNVREIIVEKNRHGETGSIFTYWKPEYVTFFELAY
jgi:replicative DNA helicase